MRYLDSGSRDPQSALGAWVAEILRDPSKVAELRWQSGFFGSTGLGLFVPALRALAAGDRPVNVLVGSNDGQTTAFDLAILLEVLGAPRSNLNIGVVKFRNAYFHPKTFHIKRDDGSATAYSGSANLTQSGVSSLHVEAGIVLDTRNGDDPAVLDEMADAIDGWFAAQPAGLYPIATTSDLDALVQARILATRRRPRPRRRAALHSPTGAEVPEPVLSPLVLAPGFTVATGSPHTPRPLPPMPFGRRRSSAPVDAVYSKKITPSDAQRKGQGNQRGSITLTMGRKGTTQKYFRFDLFAGEQWQTGTTRTGEIVEVASIVAFVSYLGEDRGRLNMQISYAANRDEEQDNYTSLLHLGKLSDDFKREDPTGRTLTIQRRTDGTYELTVT
ncbi:MAG: hypothetical protein DLM58_17800 [Pseudonocardiales bacterium]|nr:MAG: hypothetical protein DLM58_17800 [Pseudonocardiales bacterium]